MTERSQRILDSILVVGAPLLLALVEMIYPHPHEDMLQIDVQRWLVVHYVQILLFPLAALVGWIGWYTGVATGILIKAAQTSPDAPMRL